MKKVIILLLTTLTITFIFGYFLTQEYLDHQNRFSIKYPKDWTIKPSPHQKNLIKADIISQDKKTGLQIRIYSGKNYSLEEFTDWYIKQFIREMSAPVLLNKKYCLIGSQKGCQISFDGRLRNGYFLKSYIIPHREIMFVFQGGTPFKEKSRNEPILDAVARSFKILLHQNL